MRFLYRSPILIILFLSMQTVWACMPHSPNDVFIARLQSSQPILMDNQKKGLDIGEYLIVMESYQSIKLNFVEIVAKSLMVHYAINPYDWSENTYVISNVTPESDSGAYVWLNLKRYCQLTDKNIITFVEKMDFSELD